MKAFVGAAALSAASAAELKLTWSDCGAASTHTKITGFSPSTLTTGQKTTMTGTGDLDEDVESATFDLEMKTAAGTVSCKGDASASKTCNLPLGTGSLTFDALTFPIKKGSTSVSVDIQLAAALPGALANTDTTVTSATSDGSQLFCMEIKSAPSADVHPSSSFALPALVPSVVGAATDLALTWSDCGDSSTHAKITGFTPSTITTGQKATMTGTGNLDEDVSAATFDLEMKTAAGTVSCKGDASQSKTCNLPLGTGSLTFDAMAFPIKKGSTSVSVDLSLSAVLPGALAHTETTVTATATGGDKLFCVDIKSAPAVHEFVRQPSFALPTLVPSVVGAATELALTWSDCGDSSTHAKITGFTPSTITTGQKATMTGTGNLDEDVSAATFDLEMKTAAGTVSCKGDASQSKTCNLPLGTGSLTFDAMTFPIKKGSTSVSVDLSLSAVLPGALAHTETKVTATATGGDKLFCVDIKSAPASHSHAIVV